MKPFKVGTDLIPLVWLVNDKDLNGRPTRSKWILADYPFEIEHNIGKANFMADSLSLDVVCEWNPQVKVLTRSGTKVKGVYTQTNDNAELPDIAQSSLNISSVMESNGLTKPYNINYQ